MALDDATALPRLAVFERAQCELSAPKFCCLNLRKHGSFSTGMLGSRPDRSGLSESVPSGPIAVQADLNSSSAQRKSLLTLDSFTHKIRL
jgi:hypothetical protein